MRGMWWFCRLSGREWVTDDQASTNVEILHLSHDGPLTHLRDAPLDIDGPWRTYGGLLWRTFCIHDGTMRHNYSGTWRTLDAPFPGFNRWVIQMTAALSMIRKERLLTTDNKTQSLWMFQSSVTFQTYQRYYKTVLGQNIFKMRPP